MKRSHKIVRNLARRVGIDIKRYNEALDFDAAHRNLLERQKIDFVLDVGANIGQFVDRLRSHYSYQGEVVSFEPLKDTFETLSKKAADDLQWTTHNYALGDSPGSEEINISANTQSSSFLEMNKSHLDAAPQSAYQNKQIVQIETLDRIFDDIGTKGKNVFLKADVQGYEMKLLEGAKDSLHKIKAIRLEMSVIPLYQSEILIEGMISFMRANGFQLHAIEPNFSDPATGAILQVDGLFSRLA
jgi:FkbM family methyltransferase